MGVEEIAGALIAVTIALIVVSQLVGVGLSLGGGSETVRTDAVPSGGQVQLAGANVTVLEVHQSLNDSARLDGSGSISGSLGSDVADNRTVSTWARIRDQSGRQQVASIDSRTQIVYNASSAEWACWSYSDVTTETHRVAVNTSSPGALTNLQCERAGGTLELRRNDTAAVNSVTLDSANATNRTLQTQALNGSVDETRVYNGSLSATEHGTLVAAPTAPLNVSNRVARVYYDSYGSYGSVPVYISGGSLDTSAASKAPGLQGQGAGNSSDYTISGDTITLDSGGTLEGAPAIFVEFARERSVAGVLQSIIGAIGGVLALLVLLPLIFAAARLLEITDGGF